MRSKLKTTLLILLSLLVLCAFSSDALAAKKKKKKVGGTRRSKAVAYMRAMATIEWTPSSEISYWQPNGACNFKVGNTYRGLPYTQYGRETTLQDFKGFLKKNDQKKSVYNGPTGRYQYRGSDCSSSVSMAWKQVDPEFPICATGAMFPERNQRIVKAGDYDVTSGNDTKKIVADNGKDRMFAAYGKMRPGDAVLMRRGSGHVRLVVKVLPKKQEVVTIEQCGKGPNSEGNFTTWRVDKHYSYEELFNTGYIPISLKAFHAPKKKK